MPSLQLAKELFYKGNYKSALEIFCELDMNYEAGLCQLLLGDENKARNFWQKDKDPCLATKWGLIFLDLINLKVKNYPTFFQVRAFLEVYINLLIINNHLNWAENILSACDILARSNPEAYKFIARALFANGYLELTHHFINMAKEVFFYDPEAHLIQAQTYYMQEDYKKAKKSLEYTLKSCPEYAPALDFQKQVDRKLKISK